MGMHDREWHPVPTGMTTQSVRGVNLNFSPVKGVNSPCLGLMELVPSSGGCGGFACRVVCWCRSCCYQVKLLQNEIGMLHLPWDTADTGTWTHSCAEGEAGRIAVLGKRGDWQLVTSVRKRKVSAPRAEPQLQKRFIAVVADECWPHCVTKRLSRWSVNSPGAPGGAVGVAVETFSSRRWKCCQLTSHASQGGLLHAGGSVQSCRDLSRPCTNIPAIPVDTKDTARDLNPKAWGPKYLFPSLLLVDGLDEKWIGSTGQQVVVQLLSHHRIGSSFGREDC